MLSTGKALLARNSSCTSFTSLANAATMSLCFLATSAAMASRSSSPSKLSSSLNVLLRVVQSSNACTIAANSKAGAGKL